MTVLTISEENINGCYCFLRLMRKQYLPLQLKKKHTRVLTCSIILMKSQQYISSTDWSDSWAHMPTLTHNPIIKKPRSL
jgi:hypothetical protein